MKRNLREKGITLIALVVTIIILLILAGVTLNLVLGQNGLINKAQLASNTYANATANEIKAMKDMVGTMSEATSGGKYSKDKKVNIPQLKQGMTPVKFNSGNIVQTTADDDEWYNYENQEWANAQTEDGSLWVWIPRYAYQVKYYADSAKTQPSNIRTQYGKMEINFLIGTTDEYIDKDGNKDTAKRCTSESETVDTTTGFTVHPAFADESNINYRNGGWDSELVGIWVAKFEAGYANATETGTDTLNGVKVKSSENKNTAPIKPSSVNYSNYGNTVYALKIEVQGENPEATADGNISARNWQDGVYGSTTTAIKYPTFQGSTYSMNYINHGEAFELASKLNENGNIYGFKNDVNSHLMKNSEWGAVAYLAQSEYGFIGAGSSDITINSKNLNNGGTSTTQAQGNTKASVYAVTGYNNNNKEWNNGGENASTTSNIYGVYDMSGGLWERTPGYVANGNTNLSRYGGNIGYSNGTQKTVSTKYTTVYPFAGTGTADEISQSSWEVNTKIYGDGVNETSIAGTGSNGWNGDYSVFPASGTPLFLRGGYLWYGGSAGVFAFVRNNGNSHYDNGFRAVLV